MLHDVTQTVLHEYLERSDWNSLGSLSVYIGIVNKSVHVRHLLSFPLHAVLHSSWDLMGVVSVLPVGSTVGSTWSPSHCVSCLISSHRLLRSDLSQFHWLIILILAFSHLISIIIFTSRVYVGSNIWIYCNVFWHLFTPV